MQPDTRQRFQGKCLIGEEGRKHMADYDYMPLAARSRLQSSTFNLCAACVEGEANNFSYREGANFTLDIHYIKAIECIEATVLAEYGPFGPQPVNPEPLVAKPRKRRHV